MKCLRMGLLLISMSVAIPSVGQAAALSAEAYCCYISGGETGLKGGCYWDPGITGDEFGAFVDCAEGGIA